MKSKEQWRLVQVSGTGILVLRGEVETTTYH